VDTLIVIPNQNLYRVAGENMTFADAFKIADNVLCQGVRSITDLIMRPGLINLDFQDVKTVLSSMGRSMMGTGEASGSNRALEAAEQAISNPLLDNTSVKGAHSLLLNISGGLDLTMSEVDTAAERIRSELDPNANIIFGAIVDEEFAGKMRVSLVATGIDDMVNGTAEPLITKPDIPQQKPIEILPEMISVNLTEGTDENKTDEPVLMDIPPAQKEAPSLVVPDFVPEQQPSDLVVQLDEPVAPIEPTLISDPLPDMPETVAITEIPEPTPEIPLETQTAHENVKPAGGSIWDKIFGKDRKKPLKPSAKKETPNEPSFLDGLEDDMDLPPFLRQRR